ncbi:MAG: hypothetical protein E6K29_02955 [Gammaproteobacteria bacterium]|nr:MAG: hypothetical protein E6K29_02955 [Gammaproteobacteria bacterium]
MCRLLFGVDFVESHCVTLGNVNVNSPLVLDGEASRVIRTSSGAPKGDTTCCSAPIGGGRACSRPTSRRHSNRPGTRRCASR